MGKIEIQSLALKAVPMGGDFRLKLREFRELPSLEVIGKQLESFLPGGAVERLVGLLKRMRANIPASMEITRQEIIDNVDTLEALLPEQESEAKDE